VIDRFDHAAIAVRDLSAAVNRYRRLGFDIRLGGRHIGHGSHNAIIRFGLDYLELLALADEAEAQESVLNGPSLPDFLAKHEGGLVGFALATREIDQIAERFGHSGVTGFTGLTPVGPIAMQRQRPDGTNLAWRLLLPGGVIWRRPWPFLIEWDTPDSQRLAWEPPTTHPNGATGISSIAVAVASLETASSIYQDQLGLPPQERDEVPALAARRVTFRVGACAIQLLAPAADEGPLPRELREAGEGPIALTLSVTDLEQTRRVLSEAGAAPEPLPDNAGALTIVPEQADGARLVFAAPGAAPPTAVAASLVL
jgi:catechol 2,3-dioxygenase-like lactoylglutathione lyase family enzyme